MTSNKGLDDLLSYQGQTNGEFLIAREETWTRVLDAYRRKFPAGKQMPADVYRALIGLMDYASQERWHFEESDRPANHIYHCIKRVEDWMGCMWRDEMGMFVPVNDENGTPPDQPPPAT